MVTEKMIFMLKEQMLAKAEKEKAFKVIEGAPEFSRSTFYRLTSKYREPDFNVVNLSVLEDAEQRIFENLKFILPRIINREITEAAKQKLTHLDWLEVVYRD